MIIAQGRHYSHPTFCSYPCRTDVRHAACKLSLLDRHAVPESVKVRSPLTDANLSPPTGTKKTSRHISTKLGLPVQHSYEKMKGPKRVLPSLCASTDHLCDSRSHTAASKLQ